MFTRTHLKKLFLSQNSIPLLPIWLIHPCSQLCFHPVSQIRQNLLSSNGTIPSAPPGEISAGISQCFGENGHSGVRAGAKEGLEMWCQEHTGGAGNDRAENQFFHGAIGADEPSCTVPFYSVN